MKNQGDWVQFPALLDHDELLRIGDAFNRSGVEFVTEAVSTMVEITGGSHAYAMQVRLKDA